MFVRACVRACVRARVRLHILYQFGQLEVLPLGVFLGKLDTPFQVLDPPMRRCGVRMKMKTAELAGDGCR